MDTATQRPAGIRSIATDIAAQVGKLMAIHDATPGLAALSLASCQLAQAMLNAHRMGESERQLVVATLRDAAAMYAELQGSQH